MAIRARRFVVTLAVACLLAALATIVPACKRRAPAPAADGAPGGAKPAVVAPAPAPAPAFVWKRRSMTERWDHARRVQASIDKWWKAVAAGDFQAIRPLYHPTSFRAVREESAAKPITDLAAWLALREKEHRAGRVLDAGRKPELLPSSVDDDKIWVAFTENVTAGRRREHRRRRFVFQGVASPLIVSEWEGAFEPSWPDEQAPREIPIVPRAEACPGSLALAASPFWIVAGEEATHAAANARLGALRASGKQAEVVLGSPPGTAPAQFLIVTGVAADRPAADAAAARAGARVVEPAQLPAVGRGDALRLAGTITIGDGGLVLVTGQTFWFASRIGFLRRYRLDGDKLTLISELSLGLPQGSHEVWFGARDGVPHMKTKAGWVRIDPDTGAQTKPTGDPPAIAGVEAVIGDRRFTVDSTLPGIAIARGGARESFIPLAYAPQIFVATTPGGPRLVATRVFGELGASLFEVTPERPAAGVAKLCGEIVWFAGHGIRDLTFSFNKEMQLASGPRGAYEVWLPANRYLPIPGVPDSKLACADQEESPGLFLPPHDGSMLWGGGLRQSYVFNCERPTSPREVE